MFNLQRPKKTLWQQIRQYIIIALIVLEALLLFGGYDKNGRTYQWIGKYIAGFMDWMVQLFQSANGVGYAIIVLTALIRIILMPIMMDQSIKSTIQAEKMKMLKPQLDKIQKAAKEAETKEEQAAIQQATMRLYQENDLSMFGGINFLSMLIQLPIIQGLYSAIHLSNVVKGASFYGIPLDKPSVLIALIAGVFYLIQSYLMYLNTPEEQRKQMRFMMFLSPVMITFFSLSQSAALGLYFAVGGFFVLIQSIIIYIIRPSLQKRARDEFQVKDVADRLIQEAKDNPTFGASSIQDLMNNTPKMANKATPTDVTPNKKNNNGRNSGKQTRK